MFYGHDFDNLNGWGYEEGIYVEKGVIKNNTSDSKLAWYELPTPIDTTKPFRYSARILLENESVWTGLVNGSVNNGVIEFDNANTLWGGYSKNGDIPQWRSSVNMHGLGGGEQPEGYYWVSLVGDGECVNFSITDDERKTITWQARYKATQDQYTHIIVRINGDSSGVDKVALQDNWKPFEDTNYADHLRCVLMTHEKGTDKEPSVGDTGTKGYRAYCEIPDLPGERKLIICSHGNDGSWIHFSGESRMHFQSVMANNGYATASLDAHSFHNGHWMVTTQAFITRQWLLERGVNLTYKIVTMGRSMGALFACNMATDYPDMVAGIITQAGHSNLAWRYLGINGVDRSDNINDTYGCDESTFWHKTRGRNPYEKFHLLAKYPLLAIHAKDETHVKPIFSIKLVAGVNNAGGNATYVPVDSDEHSAPEAYDPEIILPWLSANVTDWSKPTHIPSYLYGAVRIQ